MLNDPGAIALIVGAIAIVVFLVHGLWFSGKPKNRKLNMKNHEDQELSRSDEVAKVRIVTRDRQGPEDEKKPFNKKSVIEPTFDVDDRLLQSRVREHEFPSSFELNLLAPEDRPYRGDDIEALCRQYGILRGEMDIFYVFENLNTRTNEVFRICSLVSPFTFPKEEDMAKFSTPALALYMNVPPPGKGATYVKALIMAANLFVDSLGGRILDIHHQDLTKERLDEMEEIMKRYDMQRGEHD